MKYLNDSGVEALLFKKWEQVINAVENVFVDSSASMIPKTYIQAGNGGDFRAMPAVMGEYAAI